ncbi:MAG: helix-turn-helix transcriptional regulator [Okeania sp. SIO2G4]|uniref:helix-turn-helix domain-containing protein n=1 Tax=unclassified Okeania TaxID=2634635 RepID=UPI0013BD3E8B|nr:MULTISPECIES: response regulator transcription factor [unclassified Okeania]NEP38495.1 helix-turn-helix transcriptional regulator [Okeania sp. SIO2H7]NEP73592.1 helix-turn-helix transcriptional regulator [Okeania sp. SIO2G5]NEP94242.1 helix-turn-helix transcriptional regulator [Okeania sp. SIO2F5]NEQ93209.1 helix-turn-helix transcriptional regulator [Okeania sp. SIO2G4]
MNTKKIHFSNLTKYHSFLGLPDPEHPLFSVVGMSSNKTNDTKCADRDITLSGDFYSVSLKHITSGEIFYGRTKYDCKNGTMIFMAPKQEVKVVGLNVKSTGRTIVFHEDFIRGYSIKDEIKKYNYFSYAVNEALHLSQKEEQMISGLIDQIEYEYHSNQDEFSKELILSQLDTLLKYANRFYHRQFLHRKENNSNLLDKFIDEVERYMNEDQIYGKAIPTIEEIANKLNMTPRYLSDALKVETGKTAIENLHLHLLDKAKDLLLDSNATVATVAYALGFEYPQYFSRLFKKKTGITPTEYIKSYN